MKFKSEFELRICKSCLMLSTRPRITFDNNGICNVQMERKIKKLNWKKRELEFIQIAKQIKSKK